MWESCSASTSCSSNSWSHQSGWLGSCWRITLSFIIFLFIFTCWGWVRMLQIVFLELRNIAVETFWLLHLSTRHWLTLTNSINKVFLESLRAEIFQRQFPNYEGDSGKVGSQDELLVNNQLFHCFMWWIWNRWLICNYCEAHHWCLDYICDNFMDKSISIFRITILLDYLSIN